MKSKHLLLMLLIAILAPWAANGQNTVTATCYPPNETYATGYTDGTDKTSGQLHVESAGGDRGWMKFDVSAIPDGATINSITLKFYCISGSNPYVNLTAAGELDPATASASELFSAIGTPSPNYFTSTYISGLSSAGWKTFGLSSNAISNLQDNGLTNDYFTVGFYAYETYSYYFNAYGYDEADYMPYIEVTYASTEPYVELSPTTAKIQPGATETLTATPGNITGTPTYSYSSSNTSVATVSGSGTTATVTGVAVGTATITVTMNYEGTNYTATSEITVSNELTVTIGSGSGTYTYLPTHTNYKYSYTQQIYTATELGNNAGTIKSVSFKGATARTRTLDIYMVNTDKEYFESKTDYVAVTNANLVYTGSVSFVANDWTTITLTGDGFDYTGDNLVIVVDDNTGSDPGSTNWSSFTATSNQGLYFYQDASNINPSSPSASNNNVTNSKNQIILTILPSATPKPRNLVVSNITSSQATISWEAPASATPTDYEFEWKESSESWSDHWTSSQGGLAVDLSGIFASTDYDVRVRAVYAEGKSDPIETGFRTLDACAFPTNFIATTTPGFGTEADFSWVKGYDETAWVLQIATDANFTTNVDAFTTGFVVDGNNVTYHATGLTPEQTYYAHVKADCSGSTSTYSDVATFTPSNYADFTYGANASTTNSNIPFYGYYANDARTISQYIIPATELLDVAGGTIRSLTYYTSSTPNWGTATVKVYVKEVDYTTFAASSAEAVEDWETMTQVYNGSLTVSNGQMTITFDNTYLYGGGNLMIGIKMDQTGTSASVSWSSIYNSSAYTGLYAYYSTSYYSSGMSYNRSYNYPKTTINYQPTPYKYPVIDEASCTFETTSAHIAWTVTGATPTGYQYQYKSASATEWPTAWTSVTTAYADLSDLTPGSFYDFRVKALYDGDHESVVVDYSFVTECAAITAFPWSEKFEAYSAGDFSHPCWVNEHISGDGTQIFKVNTSTAGSNTTHQLQLPDQYNGTLTKLRSPEMTLATGTSYQFVIDVYRNTSGTSYTSEGVRVFASANGEIEGATELGFLYRNYQQTDGSVVTAENSTGWYTYEFPIPTTMTTCYIILRGENQYGSSTYMDNLIVEEIPTCARPEELAYSDVTNHSATLTWTAGDAEQTLWQIAYSKTDFDPNTANFDVTTVTTIDATAHPFTLDKILDAASTYYVYVRANCGTATEPDFGPWSRKGINFTTLAATPAPSNFVSTNPASAKVDLVWNAGGGDTESWEIYYVASETAPEAPTEATTATVANITTLPTAEAPYVLDNLDPVTKYYAWIRAKHVWDSETTYSGWVALTGGYFETLDACPTPTGLTASNLTSVSADLSWVGSDDVDSYTVQYRTAAGMGATVLSEGFGSSIPTDWENKIGLLSEVLAGTTSLSSTSTQWYFGTSNGVFDNHARINIYGSGSSERKGWLITKAIDVTDGTVLSFDLALTAFSGTNVPAPQTNGTDDRFVVLVTTDNEATWESLREWNNSGSAYVYNNIANTATGENVVLDLSNYKGNSVKIAFYGESTESNADNYLHIDNVIVGTPTPAGNWVDATTNVEEQSFQLTGLTAGTKYDVHVKSNCTSGEYCEPISFTTLAEGTKVFTTAGEWGTATNWMPNGAPAITDEVIIRANATIESGCVAEANSISGTGSGAYTLTIKDGGQLKTNNNVTATVKKNIEGYDDPDNPTENTGWYLIANPLTSDVTPNATNGLLSGTYNLYRWDYTQELEWRNYKKTTFTLSSSNYTNQGYLYANENDTELSFTGTIRAANTNVYRSATYPTSPENYDFPGWYLMGNSFMCDAYLATANTNGTGLPYYRMNSSRNGFVAAPAGTAIAPMEGIFYEFPTTATVYITTTVPAESQGNLNMVVSQGRGSVDNAIIHFGEGQQLGKFSFREGSTKVYIPQDGKDYAVVNAEAAGEMPVNFKAEENGTYSLSFNAEEVSFSYLHLIDNMTGNDIDLLQTPSYTFNATTTDYESRFKLVFCTGVNEDSDSFAFCNNGNWIINNAGEATLQVIDVNGRILSSETVNGSVSKAIHAAPGVYMLRLINGDNVKVQKIVVR